MKEHSVEDYLINNFNASEKNLKEFFGENFYNILLQTIIACNEEAKEISEDDIRLFLIPKAENTKKFYKDMDELNNKEILYLIYDKKHNYLDSNSNEFFLLMWLLKGLTLEEVSEKPYLLKDYMQKVTAYLGF
ncbi:hypothetical protein M2140_001031 [Clostridiales Family XIII bacterium PM5-7]